MKIHASSLSRPSTILMLIVLACEPAAYATVPDHLPDPKPAPVVVSPEAIRYRDLITGFTAAAPVVATVGGLAAGLSRKKLGRLVGYSIPVGFCVGILTTFLPGADLAPSVSDRLGKSAPTLVSPAYREAHDLSIARYAK